VSLSEQEIEELELLLEAENEYQRYNQVESIYPGTGHLARSEYPKHMECFEAGAKYRQRCFMGGNGTGKTFGLGAYEMALHLTGDYPFWWTGLRFDTPIIGWACGDTRETVRDTVQKYLLGDFASEGDEALGSGILRREKLGKPRVINGTNHSCDSILVRHRSGGWSKLQFKAYEQGRKAFQGTNVHFIWLDEEPPLPIFLECIQRGRKVNGRILLTFTPLSGNSDVVDIFLSWQKTNKTGGSIVTIHCSWDDVPHLDEDWKRDTMAVTPPYLRDARRRGIPSAGIGKVYTVEEDEFVINPIPLPPHWRRFFAFDHGYFNTAAAWFAYDKDNDVIYLYSEYKRGEVSLDTHATAILARGAWIPGVGDASARESDGKQIIDKYKGLGVKLRLATKGSVDAGIQELLSRLSTGRFKVFSTCQKWLDEYRRYQYDEKQRIVKRDDHLMDVTRYGVQDGPRIATVQKLAPSSKAETVRFG
jgi:phage terminase large subunit-like protein